MADETWDERLIGLMNIFTEAGHIPFETMEHFKGIMTVARLGLGLPGMAAGIRASMAALATVPAFKSYMETTISKFDAEVLLGTLVVDTVLGKLNTEGENQNDQE